MLVDTVQPEMRFEATLSAAGEVRTRWEARDSQLLPASMKIEYQDAIGTRWRPVAIDPASGSAGTACSPPWAARSATS